MLETFTGDLHELCPHSVGVLDGSYLEGRLQEIDCLSADPATTVDSNFKKLLGGRFRYLLESENSIKYLLSTQAFSEADRQRIAAYEIPFEIDKNYTVFSRKAMQHNPDLQSALHAFDESLRQMKADGTYETILRDHGM